MINETGEVPAVFTLGQGPVNFVLSQDVNFIINGQVVTFKLAISNAEIPNLRILEDSEYRLLEDGNFRLLEN